MKMIPMVDVKAQTKDCNGEIEEAIAKVIESGRFIKGDDVEAFEEEWAEYCGAKYCVSCGNGTDALYLMLRTICVGEGRHDLVVIPVNSFIATAEAVSMTGARPIFCDCGDNYIADWDYLCENGWYCVASIGVDLYGRECGLLCGLIDACQSHGRKMDERDMAFSFFPGKNLGCFGDGGAVVTDSKTRADMMRGLKDHGRGTGGYEHDTVGINSRLDTIQAAVLRVKLKRLDKWNARRKEIAKKYIDKLNICGIMPEYVDNHSWHQFVIRIPQRERVIEELKERGIATNVHYPNLIAETYGETNLEEKYPNAYKFSKEVLSIPMHGLLPEEDVDYIIQNIKEVV